MAKNKQSTLAELVADSQPETLVVEVGNHAVTIQELTGRDRYDLAERGEDNRWDTILWVCERGIIEPESLSAEQLEAIKPSWLTKIATAILGLSGLDETSLEEAENA